MTKIEEIFDKANELKCLIRDLDDAELYKQLSESFSPTLKLIYQKYQEEN